MGDFIQLYRATAFDPEALKVLGEAYDSAMASLSGTGELEHAKKAEIIARWIVWLGQQGERDVARLRRVALDRLGHEVRKSETEAHKDFLRKVFVSRNGISVHIRSSEKQISESRLLLERVDEQLRQQWV